MARDSNFNHYSVFLSWISCQGLIQIQMHSITEIYFTITITGVNFWEAFINYDTGCQIQTQTCKSDSPFRWYMPYSFLSPNHNLEQIANENRRWWILITLKLLQVILPSTQKLIYLQEDSTFLESLELYTGSHFDQWHFSWRSSKNHRIFLPNTLFKKH